MAARQLLQGTRSSIAYNYSHCKRTGCFDADTLCVSATYGTLIDSAYTESVGNLPIGEQRLKAVAPNILLKLLPERRPSLRLAD